MFGKSKSVDVERINQEVSNGAAVLVDVREDNEWASGHAASAVHAPLGEILEGVVPTSDQGVKIYVYCASGARSSMAAQVLASKGYSVENIGGFSAWTSSGGDVA